MHIPLLTKQQALKWLNYSECAFIFNADMQCCSSGQNNECHPYFACSEAGPDLERPNVSQYSYAYDSIDT